MLSHVNTHDKMIREALHHKPCVKFRWERRNASKYRVKKKKND